MPLSVITDMFNAQIPHPCSQCSYLIVHERNPLCIRKYLMWRFWNFIAQLYSFTLCGQVFAVWSYILHVYHKYRLKMFFTVRLKTDNSMKVTFDVDSFKPTVKTLRKRSRLECLQVSSELDSSARSRFCGREIDSGKVAKAALALLRCHWGWGCWLSPAWGCCGS